MQPLLAAATAAHTAGQSGHGVALADAVMLGVALVEVVRDGCVAEGVAVAAADGVCEAVTTATGGARAGAGTPSVASAGGTDAFAQALSAANVLANSVDDADELK